MRQKTEKITVRVKRKLRGAMCAAALFTFSFSLFTFCGCDMQDPIYDTPHPGQGSVTLATDWTNRGEGIAVPASHTVGVGGYTATLSGQANTLDRLFDPGSYSFYVYNTAEHIAVSGATATADYTAGTLGWFFSCAMDVRVEKDKEHSFTAAMRQQVRQLTLIIDPGGGTADRIAGIECTLSGVAGTLDMGDGSHGGAASVALSFTKVSTGADAGKWTATVRLLGITGNEQKLTGTITFAGGAPGDMPLQGDLTAALANFNADKKTPLTLGGTAVETPAGAGFTATINGWTPSSGGTVIAN